MKIVQNSLLPPANENWGIAMFSQASIRSRGSEVVASHASLDKSHGRNWGPPFPVADPRGTVPVRAPPTAQKFLDFMQFLGKFDKIVCWHPLEGQRPSYRESWIHPYFLPTSPALSHSPQPPPRLCPGLRPGYPTPLDIGPEYPTPDY